MAIIKVKTAGVDTGAPLGRRNMIINGSHQVNQRGNLSSVTVSGSNYYNYNSTDRWRTGYADSDGLVFSVEQSTDAPDGFNYSRKYTINTPKSITDATYFDCWTRLERYSYSGVGIGTPAAKNLTLSFWVKSSETGQFAGIHLVYPTAGGSFGINFTYTINSANTWEYKTVSLPTSTLTASSYYMEPSSAAGDYISFHMGSGVNYDGGTGSTSSYKSYVSNDWAVGHQTDITTIANATWAITGLQLEIGDTATPFEHLSYGEELSLCQRYYFVHPSGTSGMYSSWGSSSSYGTTSALFPTTMRINGTIAAGTPSSGSVYSLSATKEAFTIFFNNLGGSSAAAVNFSVDAEV